MEATVVPDGTTRASSSSKPLGAWKSRADKRCAQQLVEAVAVENCSVSAVQATRESMLPYYGTVGGRHVRGSGANLYEVETVVEKPTPTEAEQSLLVPGLRAGHYLCFFGIHVLTPAVMDILAEHQMNAERAHDGRPAPLQRRSRAPGSPN